MEAKESTIYKLVCDDGHYYYGSTIQPLSSRLSDHKSHAKKKTTPVYAYINAIGWDRVTIEAVERVSCETRNDLLVIENDYIMSAKNDTLCLNVRRAYLSKEELQREKAAYYVANKDAISETHKEYNQRNALQNSEKRKDYYKKYREENGDKIKRKRRERYEKTLIKKNTHNQ